MTPAPTTTALSIALAAAVATICGLSLAALGRAVSVPPQAAQRLAAVQAQATSLRRRLNQPEPAAVVSSDAVCRDAAGEVQRVRETLSRQAQAAKMTVSTLRIEPEIQASLGETLYPLRVRFQGQGTYEAAVALLGAVAQERPLVFVDTVDLTSRTSSVALNISGRIYCSA